MFDSCRGRSRSAACRAGFRRSAASGCFTAVDPRSASLAVVRGHHAGKSRTRGRFPNRDHFASCNGTAPIEASSGERRRHRLNPKGNRTLNRALHVIAVCQIRHPGLGRDYCDRDQRGFDTGRSGQREALLVDGGSWLGPTDLRWKRAGRSLGTFPRVTCPWCRRSLWPTACWRGGG